MRPWDPIPPWTKPDLAEWRVWNYLDGTMEVPRVQGVPSVLGLGRSRLSRLTFCPLLQQKVYIVYGDTCIHHSIGGLVVKLAVAKST